MTDTEKTKEEHPSAMVETTLGPEGAGLPPIPEPESWDTSYGIDEAVAIAVVPERAMIFWELARVIESGASEGSDFRLVRYRLAGEKPVRETAWGIPPKGRFQDSRLEPGSEYLYIIARVNDGEETPLLVTNPIRMPMRIASRDIPGDLPTSIDLGKFGVRELKRKGGADS
ncbi:MAG TPA: hypothetical protein ENN67_07765 [Firmicutes bacterium]|nr:hypothetical protein [Bacillota bacterium]